MTDQAIGIQRKRLPFTQIENAVILDEGISKYGVLVYLVLCYHADKDGKCFPASSTISKEARCSRANVFNALKELETAGYIKRTAQKDKAGDKAPSVYTITGKRGGSLTGRLPISTESEAVSPEVVQPVDYGSLTGRHRTISNELDKSGASAQGSPSQRPNSGKTAHSRVSRLFFDLYHKKTRAARAPFNPACARQLKNDLERLGEETLSRALCSIFENPPQRMQSFGYMAVHTFLPDIEKRLSDEDRRFRLLKTCKACGKQSDTTGIDCPKCGEPDAFPRKEAVNA